MKLQRRPRSILFRDYWEFDLINSHFTIANALSGGRFPALRALVESREAVFSAFPGFRSGDPAIRKGIKTFFNAVFNGKTIQQGMAGWRYKFPRLSDQFFPSPFIRDFCRTVPLIHTYLHNLFPSITRRANYDGVSATTRILFHCEDSCLDTLGRQLLAVKCQSRGALGEIGGFLNDALFVWGPSLPPQIASKLLARVNRRLDKQWGGPLAFELTPPTSLDI